MQEHEFIRRQMFFLGEPFECENSIKIFKNWANMDQYGAINTIRVFKDTIVDDEEKIDILYNIKNCDALILYSEGEKKKDDVKISRLLRLGGLIKDEKAYFLICSTFNMFMEDQYLGGRNRFIHYTCVNQNQQVFERFSITISHRIYMVLDSYQRCIIDLIFANSSKEKINVFLEDPKWIECMRSFHGGMLIRLILASLKYNRNHQVVECIIKKFGLFEEESKEFFGILKVGAKNHAYYREVVLNLMRNCDTHDPIKSIVLSESFMKVARFFFKKKEFFLLCLKSIKDIETFRRVTCTFGIKDEMYLKMFPKMLSKSDLKFFVGYFEHIDEKSLSLSVVIDSYKKCCYILSYDKLLYLHSKFNLKFDTEEGSWIVSSIFNHKNLKELEQNDFINRKRINYMKELCYWCFRSGSFKDALKSFQIYLVNSMKYPIYIFRAYLSYSLLECLFENGITLNNSVHHQYLEFVQKKFERNMHVLMDRHVLSKKDPLENSEHLSKMLILFSIKGCVRMAEDGDKKSFFWLKQNVVDVLEEKRLTVLSYVIKSLQDNVPWSRDTHKYFPSQARDSIKTFLLIEKYFLKRSRMAYYVTSQILNYSFSSCYNTVDKRYLDKRENQLNSNNKRISPDSKINLNLIHKKTRN